MTPHLLIPIAARDREALAKYAGTITQLSSNALNAFILTPHRTPLPNLKRPIWHVKGVEVLHSFKQTWFHVNYTNYRKAYQTAFPEQDLTNCVFYHVMNRRVARLKRFNYLRIVPISRTANCSSGNFTEKCGIAFHNSDRMRMVNSESPVFIQYCDKADIIIILRIQTGGKVQEGRKCFINFTR